MRYICRRVSGKDFNKPCDEAVKYLFEFSLTMPYDEEEFNLKFSSREGLWRSPGKNHGVTKDGHITRQNDPVKAWGVEINSLEELRLFIEKYGDVILSSDRGQNELTIYDGYVE